MKKTRFALSLQLVLYPLIGCFLLGGLVSLYLSQRLEADAQKDANLAIEKNLNVAWNELRHIGTKIHVKDNQLMVDQTVINDRNDIPDRVSGLVGGTITYFMGDIRVATNVKKEDGSRAIGTHLARNAAYNAIFEQKKSFRGEVEIFKQTLYHGLRSNF